MEINKEIEQIVYDENKELELATSPKFNFEESLLVSGTSGYCSLETDNFEEKIKLYNACFSNPTPIVNLVGKKITVKNVFMHTVNVKNKDGDLIPQPRTVLIDENLKGYSCVSLGVFSELKNVFSVFGTPEMWEKPLTFNVSQEKADIGKLLKITLDI